MIDWIRTYRTNPDWFKDESLSEEENYHRLQVFNFIKNHDRDDDKLSTSRDVRLSEILDDDYIDPLKYLNKFIDILYTKIDLSIQQPAVVIFLIGREEKDPLGNNTPQVTQKYMSVGDMKFDIEDDLKNFLDSERIFKEFFPYVVCPNINNSGSAGFYLRCFFLDRTEERIGKKDFMNPLKLEIN
jgi:hypothetical protein